MNTAIAIPVKFSASAIAELSRLVAAGAAGEKKLRVGVKGGGCSGMTYVLDFDEAKAGDIHFSTNDIECVIDPAHEMYLFGMEIDWENGLNNRGFTFKNPNASTTCGCGTSFAV